MSKVMGAASPALRRKRAVIYVRVSTGWQADNDISIPEQKRRGHAEAEAKGWDVVGEFVDAGASGTSDENRPQFMAMIGLALKPDRPIDYIIVYDTSRFVRKLYLSILYRTRLKKNRVFVHSVCQGTSDLGGVDKLAHPQAD